MLRMKNFNQILPKFLILAVLICMFGCMLVYAKYIYQNSINGSVTIEANLGVITVEEHKANRQNDGSYVLGAEVIDKNTYILIPGLDVPKDPVVKIENKSHLEAYVFLVAVTNISDSNHVAYKLTENWIELRSSTDSGVTTTVYAYTAGTGNPQTINNTFGVNGTGEIPVLVGDLFEVKEDLHLTSEVYLNFSACMGQAFEGKSALEVYDALFNP